MRKAETAPKKLLLPLIPTLAMGIVAVMAETPAGPTPITDPRACMTLEDKNRYSAPVDRAPIRIEPPSCLTCAMSF